MKGAPRTLSTPARHERRRLGRFAASRRMFVAICGARAAERVRASPAARRDVDPLPRVAAHTAAKQLQLSGCSVDNGALQQRAHAGPCQSRLPSHTCPEAASPHAALPKCCMRCSTRSGAVNPTIFAATRWGCGCSDVRRVSPGLKYAAMFVLGRCHQRHRRRLGGAERGVCRFAGRTRLKGRATRAACASS